MTSAPFDGAAWTLAELLDAALAKLGPRFCDGTWQVSFVGTDGVSRRVRLVRGAEIVFLDRTEFGLQSEVS